MGKVSEGKGLVRMWVRQGDAVLVVGQQWEGPREGRREESLWEGGHVVAGGDNPEEQSSGEGLGRDQGSVLEPG